MKLVCGKCQRDMQVKDVGVEVVDLAYTPPSAYVAYHTDRFVCPECKAEVLVNPTSNAGAHIFEAEKRELLHLLRIGGEVVLCYETKNQKLHNQPVEYYLKE